MAKGTVVACLLAAGLGLGAGLVIAGRASSTVEGQRGAPQPAGPEHPAHRHEAVSPERDPEPGNDASSQAAHDAKTPRADDSRDSARATREAQLARELERLKKREAEVRQELEVSQRALEARDNVERSFAPREFDLARKTGGSSVSKAR